MVVILLQNMKVSCFTSLAKALRYVRSNHVPVRTCECTAVYHVTK